VSTTSGRGRRPFGRRRKARLVPPTRLAVRDLLAEALAGLAQRGARTALTVLGTVVGVGAFVTVVGLTTTTAGQVSSAFNVQVATQVTVSDVGGDAAHSTVDSFPPHADRIIAGLNGVIAAGRTWPATPATGPVTVTRGVGESPDSTSPAVWAASPGYLEALGPRLATGRLYDDFAEDNALPVVVLGAGAARHLGITRLDPPRTVAVAEQPYTVVGIIADVDRQPTALSKVFIPGNTATARFGLPPVDSPAAMLIRTRLGAAALIARQAPLALRPDRPQLLQSVPPPEAHALSRDVLGSLNTLFTALAAITLAIGAINITTTTLVAVMERTPEIGLRRSLGATPRHITAQVLAETAAIGTLGGLVGTALSVLIVLGVALQRSWTAVIDPALTLPAPLLGTVAGLLAGLYPARRASRIQPLEALRR
jgi:putative ABC transport system permease protein